MAARLFQIFSLRFKLMIVAVVAAMILIGLLVGNSIRLIDDTLVEGMNARVKIVASLLGESLKGPLARADFAVAEKIMREIQNEQTLTYLILLNPDGQVVASVGWDHVKLPPLDKVVGHHGDLTPGVFDSETIVVSDGRIYGTVKYGVSMTFLLEGKQALFRESSIIGVALVVLLFLLLLRARILAYPQSGLAYSSRRGDH